MRRRITPPMGALTHEALLWTLLIIVLLVVIALKLARRS